MAYTTVRPVKVFKDLFSYQDPFSQFILQKMCPTFSQTFFSIKNLLLILFIHFLGFYGDSNWESTRIDSICETVVDYEHDVDRLWQPHDTDEIKVHPVLLHS